MGVFVTVVAVVTVLVLLGALEEHVLAPRRRRRAGGSSRRHAGRAPAASAPAAAPAPVRAGPRAVPGPAPVPSRGATSEGLFTYHRAGGRGGRAGYAHNGPYAVIDVETTGLSAGRGDRIVEIAVARVTADGRIQDEYATLLNPDGRDTGPSFIHGISNADVRDAPRFADVVGEVLARLDGAVLVAHNAVFEEQFLAAELARAGVRLGPLPALCTLRLAQQTLATPNHKLTTLARHAGIDMPDAHAALGDVRAVAALLPTMLTAAAAAGASPVYSCPPPRGLMELAARRGARPKTRAVQLRKGTDGWMASLMARLPITSAEASTAAAAAYLDALSTVMQDGKIVADEAELLAGLAGSAGMGAAQVAALNERFLESMREATFEDQVLTVAELRQLRAAAKALGVPDYFDDLTPTAPTAPSGSFVVDVSSASAAAAVPAPRGESPRQRRCGHCRTPGHYRTRCPQLVTASG